jgi:hypothetical protein
LEVDQIISGVIEVGTQITGQNVIAGTTVVANLTGSGGAGTYRINIPQTVSSEVMYTGTRIPGNKGVLYRNGVSLQGIS